MECLFCYGFPRLVKLPKATHRQLVHYFFIIIHHSNSSSEYFPNDKAIFMPGKKYEDDIRQCPMPDMFQQESTGG